MAKNVFCARAKTGVKFGGTMAKNVFFCHFSLQRYWTGCRLVIGYPI